MKNKTITLTLTPEAMAKLEMLKKEQFVNSSQLISKLILDYKKEK